MKMRTLLSYSAVVAALAVTSTAQHAQVSAVAVDPTDIDRVWACNKDNNSVSVIDVSTQTVVAEIDVGVNPRSLTFSADGSRVFVANQRGDIPVGENWVSTNGFTTGSGTLRGSVSVIDTGLLSVQTTLSNVGVEPYGIVTAPNGLYFVVSGFRSGTMKLYDATTLTELVSFQYARNPNFISDPLPSHPVSTLKDVDEDRDGVPDMGEPRGFVVRADSQRIYVTHHKSPYVSVLDVTLSAGLPTAVTLNTKIDTNLYAFDPIFNPVPVQNVASQGNPRFLEDIALSPDGTRALVPHILHNVNHDVNHDFAGAIDGDFANRVYPALTVIDASANTFDPGTDNSSRLHHEIADSEEPAEYAPFGPTLELNGNPMVLGGSGSPLLGGTADFVVDGMQPGDTGVLIYGQRRVELPFGSAGTLLCAPRFSTPLTGNTASIPLPASGTYEGLEGCAQALITSGGQMRLTNGIRFRLSANGLGLNKMGRRAGQPGRVAFNGAGDKVLMLNRGSEDLFLYDINGSDMELRTVFPKRLRFSERPALDATTPMGDLPLGMVVVDDPATSNDDARVYVINEGNRTLSVLRVDWGTDTIYQLASQIPTLLGADEFSASEILGQEIFEDASRAQTTGRFNNSCASCHFEGGDDSSVWQRPAGPRSTMPMYGGRLATGLVLWKGVRINVGETGPMFGGENGGTGLFTDAEQQALTDFHEKMAVPLNPNLDPVTSAPSTLSDEGQDLFFGTDNTGLNPTMRDAGCAACHSIFEPINDPGPRFFTEDFLPDILSSGENLGGLDPDCFTLQENIAAPSIRNVNTGANIIVDVTGDMIPDADRNQDGFDDTETYAVMNPDADDDFLRDDGNSYLCPCVPGVDFNCDAGSATRLFTREQTKFSIPTKLGVFSTGPYFHDHVTYNLRQLVDPDLQTGSTFYSTTGGDAIYGSAAYAPDPAFPGVNKLFNGEHDIRGHGASSKVQATLVSTDADLDTLRILAFIQSL
jgi:YVTN family beta-propeller protein